MNAGRSHTADVELIRGLRGRDSQRCARSLYRSYGGEIYGFAVTRLRDAQLAEELVQDVLARAWRHAEDYSPRRGSVRTWLYAIARNAVIDAERRRGRRPPPLEHEADEPVDAHEPIERALLRHQIQPALYRPLPALLDLVSDPEREVPWPPPLLEASVLGALPQTEASLGGARRRPWRRRPWAGAGARRPWRVALAGITALTLCVGLALGIASLTEGPGEVSPSIRLTLVSSGLEPHASATALLPERRWGTEVDLVAHLAPTTGPQAYEVWFVAPAGRLSAGTFTMPSGRRQVTVRLASAARLGRYRYLGITLAPSALNPARRGPNVVRARLPA